MTDKLITILVPIYNEEHVIQESLPKIFNLKLNKEVIIINDGSTDNSLSILKHFQNKYDFILINKEKNQGKGEAIKTALQKISGSHFIVCDADLEYNPQDIIKLVQYQENNNKEDLIVYGSRFLKHKPKTFHYFVNSFLTKLTNFLFHSQLTDMETCFKLIPNSALNKIHITGKRFEIEPEITAQLLKKGYQIKELNIEYNKRTYQEGKKITAQDGWLAILTLLKEKFNK